MKNRIYIKDLKLKEFKELVHSINKADKTEFNNKYDEIFKNKKIEAEEKDGEILNQSTKQY